MTVLSPFTNQVLWSSTQRDKTKAVRRILPFQCRRTSNMGAGLAVKHLVGKATCCIHLSRRSAEPTVASFRGRRHDVVDLRCCCTAPRDWLRNFRMTISEMRLLPAHKTNVRRYGSGMGICFFWIDGSASSFAMTLRAMPSFSPDCAPRSLPT